MYCLKYKHGDRYVERLTFTDSGVGIEFTDEECRAARLEDNSHQLLCLLQLVNVFGSVMIVKHSGDKPSMDSELRRINQQGNNSCSP